MSRPQGRKRPPRDRARAEADGRRGEDWAALWLRLHGWRIVARRVRVAAGEVDLVARRSGTLACVEVKWRRTGADRDLSIDGPRLRRVVAAVPHVAARYARAGDVVRVDVLLLTPWRWPIHYANVAQL